MRRERKKTNEKNLKYFFIALIIVSTIFTFNLTTSRYMGQITANDDVIAVPIFTLSNNAEKYVITNMKPGDIKTYEFSVSNVDNEITNEILLSYTLQIDMGTNVPLTVELYDITEDSVDGQEINLTNNKTEEMEMKAVEVDTDKITKKYRLNVIWNETNNSYEYAGQEIACNITLEAVQVITNN